MRRLLSADPRIPSSFRSTENSSRCSSASQYGVRPGGDFPTGQQTCGPKIEHVSASRPHSLRESARQEMPAALRREVRLLGDLLGQVLTEFGGADLLNSVEQLRRTVIASREDPDRYEDAER